MKLNLLIVERLLASKLHLADCSFTRRCFGYENMFILLFIKERSFQVTHRLCSAFRQHNLQLLLQFCLPINASVILYLENNILIR